MRDKKRWLRINKRLAITYFSILVFGQVIGILIALRSPTFQSLMITAIILGTAWPIALHQLLYRTLLKRWASRISDT